MGYRAKILLISNDELSLMKRASQKMLQDANGEMSCVTEVAYDLFGATNVIELGDIDWSMQELDKFLSPCFYSKRIDELYNVEEDFKVISKEGVKFFIELYKKKVIDRYEDHQKTLSDLINDPSDDKTKEGLYKLFMDIKLLTFSWKSTFENTVALDEKETVTKSSLYQHAIFQLAYIYKNINFKTHSLIYIAY